MMKLALMRTARGKEDPELPLLQRIGSLELPVSEIAAQINASQSSSNKHVMLHGGHYACGDQQDQDPTHLQAV